MRTVEDAGPYWVGRTPRGGSGMAGEGRYSLQRLPLGGKLLREQVMRGSRKAKPQRRDLG